MGSASTSELRPESRVGPYRIVRRIAIGGMAEVFLAHDAKNTRDVVLKVPLPDVGRSTSALDALEHEARVTSRLRHPHIVETLGFERHESRSALVLEYIDGCPLDAIVASPDGDPWSPDVALRVVIDVLSALEFAHRTTDESGCPLRLVHRDVNPHNVLVSREGVVKLTDFGIARSRLGAARTRTGTIKGTLRYLAPEQATGSDIDERTDLYAVGLLMFELLSGTPYADGETELDLLREAENPTPRDLPERVSVAPEVLRILRAALARFPEERPASAAAMRARLEPLAATELAARTELARRVRAYAPSIDIVPVDPTVARTTRGDRLARSRVGGLVVLSLAMGGVLALAASRLVDVRVAGQKTERVTVAIRDVAETPPSVPALATSAAPADAPAAHPPSEAPRRAPSSPPERPASARASDPLITPAPTAVPTPTTVAADTPVAPVRADRDSVRAQLVQANDAIRRARERGLDVARLQALSRDALEAYGEGRYEASSAIVSRILALIAHE